MHGSPARLLLCLVTIGITAIGCRMVTLNEGAGEVIVLADPDSDASEEEKAIASTCEELGRTRVSVLGKMGFIERNPEKVARELDTMARNAAADLGGNAVVATEGIADGGRRYLVLRCPSS